MASCSSQPGSSNSIPKKPDAPPDTIQPEDMGIMNDTTGGDVYYSTDCFRAEYFFCPPLDAIWKVQIITNICKEPPEVIEIGECEQYFECDPSDDTITKKECTDINGVNGYLEEWCEKGKYVESECVPCLPEKCNNLDDDCDGNVDEDLDPEICINECGEGELVCINGELICKGPEPIEEVCDYLDNDCDGIIDEGVKNACDECGPVPPEICDGADNDCDGSVDEDLDSSLCVNECGLGDLLCINGSQVCVGQLPQEEICNNLDDDCDGSIDEGEWECENECGIGELLCIAGEEICTAPTPTEEICDYLDNDCDGEIDEGQRNACDECGPVPEDVCNGKDDDCDGTIDENLIDTCETICGEGVSHCVDGAWNCTAAQPEPEMCDMLDNDCDGEIDEELDCQCTWFGILLPCDDPPLICGSGYQTCLCTKYELNWIGEEICVESMVSECTSYCWALGLNLQDDCYKTIGDPVEEQCNNWDDDCDNKVDEYLVKECYTGPEETLGVGICHAGEMMCYNGKWGHSNSQGLANFIPGYCKDQQLPLDKDSCDGTDSDCDGIIDDGKEMEDTDILFIVDSSGSMNLEMKGVMGALESFATYYSDEEVLQWGVVAGPMQGTTCSILGLDGQCFKYEEYLLLHSALGPFTSFVNDLAFLETFIVASGSGAEMLYDAVYLSLYDLAGAPPYDKSTLTWNTNVSPGVFSIPQIDEFVINWRDNAHHVVIVFTDEPGLSYLNPQINLSDLTTMLPTADDVTLYAFTPTVGNIKETWEPIALSSGGSWYPLPPVPAIVYESLMTILDETACSE